MNSSEQAPSVGIEPAPPPSGHDDLRTLALAHGHALRVEGGRECNVLSVVDPDGLIHLEIAIDASGVRISARGVGLSLTTSGALAISADHVSLHGKSGIALTTDGDARIEAAGALETTGHSQTIRSRRGDIVVQANDDVRLTGERIRLNP